MFSHGIPPSLAICSQRTERDKTHLGDPDHLVGDGDDIIVSVDGVFCRSSIAMNVRGGDRELGRGDAY